MRISTLAFSFMVACGVALGGCGHSNNHGPGGGGDDLGVGTDDGGGSNPDDGGMPNTHPLAVAPDGQMLTVVCTQTGKAACMPTLPTLQLSATQDGQSVAVVWSVDKADIGAVDKNGVFKPTGTSGGRVIVTAIAGRATGTAQVTVVMQWKQTGGDPDFQNPPATPGAGGAGGVGGDGPAPPATPTQQTTLDQTPTGDADVKLLYPTDGTIFPRGLLAPVIQWANGPPSNLTKHSFDGVRVHIKENNFDYTGYFGKPIKVGAWANTLYFDNFLLPQAVWKAALLSNTGEAMSIELVFSQGAQAFGPYHVSAISANGLLKGTVYYNSYGTQVQLNGMPLANSGEPSCGINDNVATACTSKRTRTGPDFGAATLAIKPGRTAPTIATGAVGDKSACRVCHSVAANGGSLITQHGDDYSASSIYTLTTDPATEIAPTSSSAVNVAMPAVYPDGSFIVSSCGGPINQDSTSNVYMTPTLTAPPANGPHGLPSTLCAATPSFAPDGTQMTFNYAKDSASLGDGASLAVISYNPTTKQFGAVQKLFTPAGGHRVAWPAFTPDGKGIVFEVELGGPDFARTWHGATGELWYLDVASKQAVALKNLNGAGSPYGTNHGNDAIQNFEPTINPVVSGGYAWVVFTTRRLYGSIGTIDPATSDPRNYHWLDPLQTTTKKLWVAAIDLNAKPGVDPSHPAFYLPAQELLAGNSRGYWSVDPCRPDNDARGCDSGDECCSGYCVPKDGSTTGEKVCTSNKPSCAAEYDKCDKSTDCCGYPASNLQCINHVCTRGTPQIP